MDRVARKTWLNTTLQQLDHHQDTSSQLHEHERDEEIHEQQQSPPQQQGDLPRSGIETATPAQTPAQQEINGGRAPATHDQQVPTRLSFANSDPSRTTWETIGTTANMANSAPVAPATWTGIPQRHNGN